jgi:hypothetical protein
MAEWLREMSVGEWYEAGDQPFEIVGVDASAGVVLVQHFDGSLEEFDFDSWLELNALPCAAPEDISGALDLERDDVYDDASTPHNGHASNPLEDLNARLSDDY